MAGFSSRVIGIERSGTSLCFLGALTVRTPSRESDEVMVRGSTSSGILYFLLNSLAIKPCSSFKRRRKGTSLIRNVHSVPPKPRVLCIKSEIRKLQLSKENFSES